MQLQITKRWDILVWKDNPVIWSINIHKKYTDIWYKEMMRRFNDMCNLKTEEDKKKFLELNPCYDIDESYECSQISLKHLRDMLDFLTK